nr:hypothetical protein Iba_chr10eCG9300 [Ipomoea batatas]
MEISRLLVRASISFCAYQFLCEHPLAHCLATQFMGIGHKQTHDRQSDVESALLGIGHNLRKSPSPETASLTPPQIPYVHLLSPHLSPLAFPILLTSAANL